MATPPTSRRILRWSLTALILVFAATALAVAAADESAEERDGLDVW